MRAAGHRRAVAAALADHRRGFAGDGRLVDRGDAFDDFAVAGYDVAGLDQHESPDLEAASARHAFVDARRLPGMSMRLATCLGPRLAQRVGLGLAAPSAMASAKLANSTVNHSQTAIWTEQPRLPLAGHEVADEERRWSAALTISTDEHDRVVNERARIELDESEPRSRA